MLKFINLNTNCRKHEVYDIHGAKVLYFTGVCEPHPAAGRRGPDAAALPALGVAPLRATPRQAAFAPTFTSVTH